MMKNTFFFLLVKVPVAIIIVQSVGKDGKKMGEIRMRERMNGVVMGKQRLPSGT